MDTPKPPPRPAFGLPSPDQAEPLLAVRATPVLDDLAVAQAQDRRAVDLDPLTGWLDVEEGGAGVRADHRPVRYHQIVGFDHQVHEELVVRERGLYLPPPLLLVRADILADTLRRD